MELGDTQIGILKASMDWRCKMEIKQQFIDAVKTGREIEFSCCGQHYFESRRSDTDWYIYCEETKLEQHFNFADDLLKNATLKNQNINNVWEQISIQYIL